MCVRFLPYLESAERAAASGDLAAAEALLHEVVRLQEAGLGPRHADLASTFNNLAVVCEMANKPADAEQFYRRAYAIASASLDPQDPLVATSLNNLREFCLARGVAFDSAARVEAEPVRTASPAERPPTAHPKKPNHARGVAEQNALRLLCPPAARSRSSHRPRHPRHHTRPPRRAQPSSERWPQWCWSRRSQGSGRWGRATAPVPPKNRQQQLSRPHLHHRHRACCAIRSSSPIRDAGASRATACRRAPKDSAAGPAPQGTTSINLLEAKVCQTLSTEGAQWRCVAPSSPARPGRLSFYTRVAASRDVRVRHRWYHGERLVQTSASPCARTRARATAPSAARPSMRREEASGASKSGRRMEQSCARNGSSCDDSLPHDLTAHPLQHAYDSERRLLHERERPRGPDPARASSRHGK